MNKSVYAGGERPKVLKENRTTVPKEVDVPTITIHEQVGNTKQTKVV